MAARNRQNSMVPKPNNAVPNSDVKIMSSRGLAINMVSASVKYAMYLFLVLFILVIGVYD